MYRSIAIDPTSTPFAMSADLNKQRDDLFPRIDEINQAIETRTDAKVKIETLRNALAILRELSQFLDQVDGQQAERVGEAQSALDAVVAKANDDLIKAGLATPETVYIYGDKIGIAPAVCQARETLTRFSEWTSRGTRQVIAETTKRLSHDLATIERMLAARQPALV